MACTNLLPSVSAFLPDLMVGGLAGTGLPDGEDADSLFLGNIEDIQVSVLDGQVGNYVQ